MRGGGWRLPPLSSPFPLISFSHFPLLVLGVGVSVLFLFAGMKPKLKIGGKCNSRPTRKTLTLVLVQAPVLLRRLYAHAPRPIAKILESTRIRRTISDAKTNPATIGEADAPIPAENRSREAEYVPPPPGSDDGVATRTCHQRRLRYDEGRILLSSLLGCVRVMIRRRIPHPRPVEYS